MRRKSVALAALYALVTALPAGAEAAALKPGSTPHAIAWFGAPPGCPAAEAVDGRAAAQAARDLTTGKTKVPGGLLDDGLGDGADEEASVQAFMASVALGQVTDAPATVVAVCDPAAARTGQALGTITGEARDVPEAELLGAGLRSRGGEFGRASASAAIGDRFVLPASGAGSVIDVAVDTSGGTATTRIGPVGAPPAAVRVAGQLSAPQVVVEYADGTSTTHPVAPREAGPVAVAAKVSKARLVLDVKAPPGAFVAASATNPDSSDSMDSFSDPADLQVVRASGTATVRLGPLGPSMRNADATVIDADRRAIFAWSCTLRWSKARLRSVNCAGGPGAAERPRIGGSALASRTRLRARPRAASRRAAPSAAPAPAAPLAQAARKPALAAMTATAMYRARGDEAFELAESLFEEQPLFADVTGDGRPESSLGDGFRTPARLLVSAPAGRWAPVKLRGDRYFAPSLSSGGDLNGDGVQELWATSLDGNARAVAGTPAWSAAPPKAIDVRTDAAGPRDLLASDAVLPVPLPDATGDGRPELAVPLAASLDHAALAVVASNDAPLGQRLFPPAALGTDPGGIWDAFATADASPESAVYDPETPAVATADGLVTVAPMPGPTGQRRLAIVRLAPDGRSAAALPAFTAAGVPRVSGYDLASGELLVTTTREACSRRSGCVTRVLRVDRSGKIVAGLARRGLSQVTAHFAPDGPDADQRAEVVLRDPEDYGRAPANPVPGSGRTIALWESASGSAAWARLPVLAVGGAAIKADGPLLGWTSRTGQHHVGTWSLRGTSRNPSVVLLDLAAPR